MLSLFHLPAGSIKYYLLSIKVSQPCLGRRGLEMEDVFLRVSHQDTDSTLVLGPSKIYTRKVSWQTATEMWIRGLVCALEAYSHTMWQSNWADDLELDWFTRVAEPIRADAIPVYELLEKDKIVIVRRPAVVRLDLQYYHPPKIVFNRKNVFIRDGYYCQYCRNKFSQDRLTLDHVLPRSRGGKTSWENIVSACRVCNERKADRTPEEWGVALSVKPSKPETLQGVSKNVEKENVPFCWIPYLEQAAM